MSAEVRILTLLHTRRILEPYVYVKRGTTQTTDAAPAGHHYTIRYDRLVQLHLCRLCNEPPDRTRTNHTITRQKMVLPYVKSVRRYYVQIEIQYSVTLHLHAMHKYFKSTALADV